MAFQKHTKVFTVFSFLRLKGPDIKWYQWIYPTALSAIVLGGYFLLGDWIKVPSMSNLIEDINSLMGILIGFYIAALAAVSSFTNENLDTIMKGRPPIILVKRKGDVIEETLTRRRFLAIIFGYCAVLSIVLYVFGVVFVQVTWNLPNDELTGLIFSILRKVAWAVYTWGLASLLVVTLLSLHYLVERMHRA